MNFDLDTVIEGLATILVAFLIYLFTAWIVSLAWNLYIVPFGAPWLSWDTVAIGGVIIRWVGHRLGLDKGAKVG